MKRPGWIALVIALMLIGSGCGDDEGSAGGGAQTPDVDEVAEARAEGDVTWCIGKDTTGAFSTVVKNFNEANPARVRLLELPEAADEQRRLQIQRLRAESPECDVLGMDVIWTAEYAAQGWLMDLTQAVEERGDAFIESTLDTAEYDGKYWAFPFNTNAGFIYWRTDQVGDEPPASWEDMYDAAGKNDGFVYQAPATRG